VGLILFAMMAAGAVLGLGITAVLGAMGVAMTAKRAKRHARVWRVFAAAFVALLCVLVALVYAYPYEQVRPGSDYEIAAKNLFLQGLGYCAAPGIAGLLAALAAMMVREASDA
jgi:Na+/proline symporter